MDFIYNNPKLRPLRRSLRKSSTDAENILWRQLRNKQILGLKFFRQYSVGSFILDFYCPKKLGIELDGGQHAEKAQQENDEERTQYIKTRGTKILRFWNNEISTNLEGVVDTILQNADDHNPY